MGQFDLLFKHLWQRSTTHFKAHLTAYQQRPLEGVLVGCVADFAKHGMNACCAEHAVKQESQDQLSWSEYSKMSRCT